MLQTKNERHNSSMKVWQIPEIVPYKTNVSRHLAKAMHDKANKIILSQAVSKPWNYYSFWDIL